MIVECDHTIRHMKQWMKRIDCETPLVVGPGISYVTPEPLGVVCILGTWNFPLATTIGPLI